MKTQAPIFARRDDCRQFIADFNKRHGAHILAQPRTKGPEGYQPTIRNAELWEAAQTPSGHSLTPRPVLKLANPTAVRKASANRRTMLLDPAPENRHKRTKVIAMLRPSRKPATALAA